MQETKQVQKNIDRICLCLKTDQQLIESFLDNNNEAIGILVERYQRQIYFLCLRIVEDHEDALELVQKTFMQVIQKLSGLQKTNSFKTWLYRISLNLCYNFLREKRTYKHAIMHMPVDIPFYLDDPLLIEERTVKLKEFLDELTERQRNAILLRIYHNLSYHEIAEIMGCREVTARSHFHLGLKKLAGKFKEYGLTL